MLFPCVTVCDPGDADRLKSGAFCTFKPTLVEWVSMALLSVPVTVMVKLPDGVAAPVVMVRVDDPEPPLIEAGLKLAEAPEGSPLALNATVPP